MAQMLLFMVVNAILLFAKVSNIDAQAPLPVKGRLLTAQEGCGFSKVSNTKITGGTPARPGAFPWIALIGYLGQNDAVSFKCGGSLITSRHILTAAHCITAGLAFVRLGEPETDEAPRQEIGVIRADVHPYYTDLKTGGSGTYDVAILTLKQDVEFTDRIRPICLPMHKALKHITLIGQSPFVAGWGMYQYSNGTRSNVLKQLQVPVHTNAICEAAYRIHLLFSPYKVQRTHFSKAVLCAGNVCSGPGICCGDSGMPLMLPFFENGQFPMYQIGIVSWGFDNAKPFVPGVYARVTSFMDWIQQTVSQQ